LKKKRKTLKHPPYFIDMSPCDFDLFERWRNPYMASSFTVWQRWGAGQS